MLNSRRAFLITKVDISYRCLHPWSWTCVSAHGPANRWRRHRLDFVVNWTLFQSFLNALTHTHKPWMLQQKRHKKTRTHPLLFIFLCSSSCVHRSYRRFITHILHHPAFLELEFIEHRDWRASTSFHILPNHKLCNHVYCDRRVLHNHA